MHAKPCATTPPGAGPSVPGAAPGEGRPSRAARVASTKARTSAVTSNAVTSSVQLSVVCQTPHRSWKRWTPWVCSVSRAYGCRRHRPCRSVCSRRVRPRPGGGDAAGSERSSDMAMFVAVIPRGLLARFAQSAQMVVGPRAAPAEPVVLHAAQVAGIRLEGGLGARRRAAVYGRRLPALPQGGGPPDHLGERRAPLRPGEVLVVRSSTASPISRTGGTSPATLPSTSATPSQPSPPSCPLSELGTCFRHHRGEHRDLPQLSTSHRLPCTSWSEGAGPYSVSWPAPDQRSWPRRRRSHWLAARCAASHPLVPAARLVRAGPSDRGCRRCGNGGCAGWSPSWRVGSRSTSGGT